MKLKLISLALFLAISFSFGCSKKNQAIIRFTSVDSNNVSHKAYVSLGKILFGNEYIAKELHGYETTIDHKEGKIVFDAEDKKQFQVIMKKTEEILKKHNLKISRVLYQECLVDNKSPQLEKLNAIGVKALK